MAEVNLSSDLLTILGGPSSVTVDLDIGAQGTRGSYILVGYGKPNLPTTIISETPQVYDMYINILASDDEYLYIYQYLNTGVATTWVRLMKLTPNTYSTNLSEEFVAGTTTVNIPISSIVPSYPQILSNVTAANFNIQATLTGQLPNSIGVAVGSIITDPATSLEVLPITVNAVEYDGSSWADVTGTKTLHLYITVV